MKAIIGVLLISLLLDQLHATKETEQSCNKKTGINPHEKGISDERYYTHMACQLNELNILNKDGTFNPTAFEELFPKVKPKRPINEIAFDCHLNIGLKVSWEMAHNIMACTDLKSFLNMIINK